MVKISSMTEEQIAATRERVWRNGELDYTDKMIHKIEDGQIPQDASAWRAYRVALRRWPEGENFPNSAYRPQRPL